ncbi:hypothetical protein HCC61_14780 [Streptomyces sp. HNM0575]|uniref:hypothetical protein n=1 Tax=Streptomyces sp. HNM0575 TaxID=2716338 RepID=UPI00145C6F88|nr:hypothetical protein [Streptomyces sp. HNM0575]NLU73929.1 hypothetical protein [Streptomyces sp. HNM0575]
MTPAVTTTGTTTSGTAARPGRASQHRTGSARRRLRVNLLMHRAGLAAWVLLVILAVAWLLWLRFGPEASAVAQLEAQCDTSGEPACMWMAQEAHYQYESQISDMVWALRDVLPITAALAGAAVVARELANGTAELAWTQSVTPARWLAEKLLLLAVFLAAGTGVLVVLCRNLLDSAGARRLLTAGYETNDVFFAMGPAVVIYALLGLAFGFLAALLLRAPLLALPAGALATWAAAWVIGPWRTQLWPTVSRTARGEGPFGHGVTRCQYDQSEFKYSVDACLGARPASHYWPVQLTETGFVLLLVVLVAAAAFWRLRRRTG